MVIANAFALYSRACLLSIVIAKILAIICGEQYFDMNLGVGLSLGQQVTEWLGLFARIAYSDKNAYSVVWFWSAGANLKGLIPLLSMISINDG
jgi:hypothetical protein